MFLVVNVPLMGILDFSSREAHFALNGANSRMFIKNPSGITGWAHDSIVKRYGNVAANTWTEAYANNTTITFAAAPTNMVYNNSNAINKLALSGGGGSSALSIQIVMR